jgi:hypothetical protein
MRRGYDLPIGALPGRSFDLPLLASPAALFAAGEQGLWYDYSDLSTVFQDAAGTIPGAVGSVVGLVRDKSGRGNHASQATTSKKPILRQSGSLFYLQFDGVDDALVTGNMDLSASDKLSLFVALDKLSNAALGIFAELQTVGSNGTFRFSAPENTSGPYKLYSKGTALQAATSPNYTAPDVAVVTGTMNISAPQIVLRRNGSQVAVDVANQGTGNFGSAYPLYIGGRTASSFPFNGYNYGLVLRGGPSTAAEIARTEQYLAAKTGISF